MRPSESSSNAVSFGHCWRRLVFANFLAPCYDVRGRMHSFGDLYPRLVESLAFSSFGRWLQLLPILRRRLSCPESSGDCIVSLLWTFACFHLSLAFFVGIAFLCVCERFTERSLGRVLPSYHFWLLKFLLHTMKVRSFGPSDILAWSQSTSFARASSSRRVSRITSRLASPPSS